MTNDAKGWRVLVATDGSKSAERAVERGMAAQALTAAFTASFVGATFANVLITFFALLLAEVALKFGPPEFFAIQLLTFSAFVGLGGGAPSRPWPRSSSASSWPPSGSTS